MSPELLTIGPRGRRLCLDFARALDDEVAESAQRRAIVLDNGSTLHSFVSVAVAGEPQPTEEQIDEMLAAEAARPVPTVAEVAGLLERVSLPEVGPDQRVIADALADSVATAMYWQPPEGGDVLAGRRELDDGLARIAAWLAPHVPDWWTAPMASDQWAHGWWGHDPRETVQSVATWRAKAVAEENRSATQQRVNRVEYPREGWSPTPGLQPADVDAPISGTWWSFPDGLESTRAIVGVPLGLDLTEDAGDTADVRVSAVDVPAGARVLEIDEPQMWVELCREHPLEVTGSRRHDWYRVTGRDGRWVIPDWAAVAESCDAVHLTTAAYLAGATRALAVDEHSATMIAGRGPDVTQWLKPVQAGPPGTWGYDQDSGTWTPH